MDVGTILADGTFDLHDVLETEQLLLKTDEAGVIRTRFMYKNLDNQMVLHDRQVARANEAKRGSLLVVGPGGCAAETLGTTVTNNTVARLLTTINWDDTSGFATKTVEVDGVTHLAVLAPVALL